MNKELVSVAVISFNSSSTILETLDSILAQSYGSENIELIISDDGSKDNTIDVINLWLKNNEVFFKRVKLIANSINSGIPKNCNVAWRTASCDWIKTIAGDDILLPNCITDNVKESKHIDQNVGVIFSMMDVFYVSKNREKKIINKYPMPYHIKILGSSLEEQFNYLKYGDIAAAPSAFIRNSALQNVNYADERFGSLEDLPLWYNMVKAGWRLSFLDEVTVQYRVGESTTSSSKRLVNEVFIKDIIKIDDLLIRNDLENKKIFLNIRKYIWPRLVLFIAKSSGNKISFLTRNSLRVAYIIKPYGLKSFISSRVKKIINKY
ncbi:glycosyltransferase family 2 protein [Pectobacterium aquaticum]|uniref:Glycosyltransferase n=1 Tax=Pectobacterium aquaticum TaxID=2204145 RepID=A0A3R8Q6E7_9GAMM|nr:glycosyltransferase [Pectobacterium aquaticum]RRO06021.1 glycosyltransferase [Pectobacterium aquaticum]